MIAALESHFLMFTSDHLTSLHSLKVDYLGPVVQSVVSLTSSFVVKILTVLVSTISNSPIFFAEKNFFFQQKY